jgi:hypothetical protein
MNRKQRRAVDKIGRSSIGPPTLQSPVQVNHTLQERRNHRQAGRLSEAEAYYRGALTTQPDHADAVYLQARGL